MSSLSTATGSGQKPNTPSRPRYKVTGWRVVGSEWAKLWSLRSTGITLVLALLFLLTAGIFANYQYHSTYNAGHVDSDFAHSTAVDLSLFGTPFAQLAIGVLGVLVMAGQYSTGMIRSTLAAVPRRPLVLWSKAALYGLVALLVSTTGTLLSFLLNSPMVSGTPAAKTLLDPGVLRCLLGAGLYLGLVGVISIALGALLRSVAGGISVLVGVFLLVPVLAQLLPNSW
ncbi:hypothetical protein SAMN05216259_12533 [Actinacidiphila guanduensis]|uniref:ABC transporter permease n=1 Tax=Actinacidiphila guanduensis TaxID=310781 RepID=A0A1H0S2G6_9ACTN|nr:hypothetical protein SAMN05216259_12533 [Actinacidiphila guanduensis]